MSQGTQLDVEYTSYDAEDDILGPADVLDSSSEEEDEARADDDQLQLRSILNATEGLTRKHNPRKRYGPQQDVWCSFATGAVISAHVISSLQSQNPAALVTPAFLVSFAHASLRRS
eukprot:Em0007g1156a